MSAWLSAWSSAFDGFAWPWLLLALPLPWVLRAWLPATRSTAAALNVPYGARLDAIAGTGGLARAAHASWWLWLAWVLLCVAAARPQQLGEAVQQPPMISPMPGASTSIAATVLPSSLRRM